MTMNRNLARYLVNWKIALIHEGAVHAPNFHGKTHDLTLVGTGMLTNRDTFTDAPVTILLAIPPLHRSDRQKIIEIGARQIYSVYSGETSCFRLGLEFLSFKEDGFDILKEGLSHYRPVLESRHDDPFPTLFGKAGSYRIGQSSETVF